MPTLEQHPLRAKPMQVAQRSLHVGKRRRRGCANQYARLRQIRRDHPRYRHERITQRSDRVFAQQMMTALRHHHRIEHDVAHNVMSQPVRDRRRNLRGRHHADLHRVHAHIGEDRIDLLGDKCRIDRLERSHALRVLRRQRGDHRHAIGAEGRERLQVGLNAGTPTGIRTRDGKDVGDHAATAGAASFSRGNTSWPNSRRLFSASACVRKPERPMKIRWPKPPSSA